MYFTAVVLLRPGTRNIPAAVDHLMDAYSPTFGGPPWRDYLDADALRPLTARHHRVAPTNLKKLAAMLQEETGLDYRADEGGIYRELIHNPNWRYDTYALKQGLEGGDWPVAAMPRDLIPDAVITPDGVWHDCWVGPREWGEAYLRASDRQAIQRCAYDLIGQYLDHHAVALGCRF
jgi:hypothetical protein